MAYTVPQVLVFQEFTESPDAVGNPLRAIIVGPNAVLRRYADPDEKTLINLGAYDPDADTAYAYPNRPTGGIVDQSYFKLYGEDVLLRYFHDPAGSGGTQAPVANYKNRIRSDTHNYIENIVGDTTYARSTALYDRDVQVGDIVHVTGTVDGEAYTLRAAVRGIVGDTVPGTVAAATGDDNNQATVISDAAEISQTAGPYNCVSATADPSGYDGTVDGHVTETYTIKVVQSSVGGDLTTARLRITSASGEDNEDNVQPSAAGEATAIGSRGLLVTFDFVGGSCSLSAESQDVSDQDLIEGQTWVVEVEQAFTAPTATSAGTYSGSIDTKYIITVTRGGSTSGSTKPQITVTTQHGIDVSGPTNVTGAGTNITVGTQGVLISFDQTILRKGDVYYIDVTAAHEGNMRTLVLSKNMPDDFLNAADLTVSLFIKKSSMLIPEKRKGSAPDVNYELGTAGVADTGFTVAAGMQVTDSSWTDDGEELPLDVIEATLYAEYRAWVPTVADAIYGLSTEDDFDDIPGDTHPDNPLKYGVSKAFANANGVEVLYIAVADPDDQNSWEDAIEKMVGYRGLHGIVPLTKTKSLVDLFVAHALSQSSAENGRWRAVWTALEADETAAVVDTTTSTDGDTVLATVSDDPDVSGNQYVIVRVPAGNGDFITNGVRAGDTLRINYTTDGWGDIIYEEYEIDQVINEDELRLVSGPDAEITVARKIEVWRTFTPAELATQLANKAAAFGQQRVRAVWPDEITAGGEVVDSMYLACALAGLRSGVLPNQGLTNLAISGFDEVPRTNKLFNATQLNAMADAGVWIVYQNDDGNIVTRHALTTAGFGDVLMQEEMINANVDSMSMINLESVEDLIGVANVVPGTADIIDLRMEDNIDRFKQVRVERIGGQLVDGSVLSVEPHVALPDRFVVSLQYVVPSPLNNLEVRQQIVV